MSVCFVYYKPKVLILVVVVLEALSSLMLSFLWGYGLMQGVGSTAIVVAFFVLYDKYLWKIPVLNFINIAPDLNGTYEGDIQFTYEGKDQTKRCKLIINQTCSFITVKSFFTRDGEKETQSKSTEAFISTDETGNQQLYLYYHNQGSNQGGDTLEQHDGINVFDININKSTIELDGYYFTNREPQTKGIIKVSKKS